MSDEWEICRDRHWRDEEEDFEWGPLAYASLNKRGEIALNPEAFRLIQEPASVTLLWDGKERRIGVKSPVSADDNFFPVREYGRGGRMRIVRAARLLKQFDVKVERTIAFYDVPVETYKGEPMLLLEFTSGFELGGDL